MVRRVWSESSPVTACRSHSTRRPESLISGTDVTRSGPSCRGAPPPQCNQLLIRAHVGHVALSNRLRFAGTKSQLSLVAIVRAASELDVIHRCRAPRTERHDVMELQKPPFGAAAPGRAHEGALPSVTSPYRALDLGRDVARMGGSSAVFPGAVRGGELLPGQPSRSAVRARSKIAAGSPSGIWWRRSACASRSFSYVSALAVNCTLYRWGARGATTAGRVGMGAAVADPSNEHGTAA